MDIKPGDVIVVKSRKDIYRALPQGPELGWNSDMNEYSGNQFVVTGLHLTGRKISFHTFPYTEWFIGPDMVDVVTGSDRNAELVAVYEKFPSIVDIIGQRKFGCQTIHVAEIVELLSNGSFKALPHAS